jgi:hypothetical protein
MEALNARIGFVFHPSLVQRAFRASICLYLQKPAQICIPEKKSHNEPKRHSDSHRAASLKNPRLARNTNQHRATRRNNSHPFSAERTHESFWHTYPKIAPAIFPRTPPADIITSNASIASPHHDDDNDQPGRLSRVMLPNKTLPTPGHQPGDFFLTSSL